MKNYLFLLLLITRSSFASERVSYESTQGREKVIAMKALAYEDMSSNYTHYAELFNLCQKTPSAKACDVDQKRASTNYLASKARYDVFTILVETGLFLAPLPKIALNEFYRSLIILGYAEDTGAYTEEVLLDAANLWNKDHGFKNTEALTLIQLSMLQAQIASKT